jgi:hypothetical protein
MSDSVEIKATLKKSGDQYVFDVPTTKNVKQGQELYWKVKVKDLSDPSTVGLSVVFHGSNSEIAPPSTGLGQRNYPFPDDTATSSTTDPNDSTQAQFTLDFANYKDEKWSTSPMVKILRPKEELVNNHVLNDYYEFNRKGIYHITVSRIVGQGLSISPKSNEDIIELSLGTIEVEIK